MKDIIIVLLLFLTFILSISSIQKLDEINNKLANICDNNTIYVDMSNINQIDSLNGTPVNNLLE